MIRNRFYIIRILILNGAFFASVIFLGGCIIETPSLAPSNDSQLLEGWLDGDPCSPPCWQGIVPGKTLASEAANILRDHPEITNVQMITSPSSLDDEIYGVITWDLNSNGRRGGMVDFSGQQTLVDGITVILRSPVSLQEIIDIHGEPSHVFAFASPCLDTPCTVYRLIIVYIDLGFALRAFESHDTKPEFSSDWKEFTMLFFEPTLEGFGDALGNPTTADSLTPWKGMLGFDGYCQGESCPAE